MIRLRVPAVVRDEIIGLAEVSGKDEKIERRIKRLGIAAGLVYHFVRVNNRVIEILPYNHLGFFIIRNTVLRINTQSQIEKTNKKNYCDRPTNFLMSET
jgi:hypothetical protein